MANIYQPLPDTTPLGVKVRLEQIEKDVAWLLGVDSRAIRKAFGHNGEVVQDAIIGLSRELREMRKRWR